MLYQVSKPGVRQREQVEQIALAEHFVADDVDLADLGHLAFGDVEVDRHAVALERSDRGGDLHRVLAARQILGLELLLGLLQQAAVEDAALSQPDLLERVAQLVLVEFLLPDEIDLGDGGTLDHETTSTLPSASRRTSLKKPVA